MEQILCIDDDFGMMFNHRRQSQDRILRKHIMNNWSHVYMTEYSKRMFETEELLPGFSISIWKSGEVLPQDVALFVEDPDDLQDADLLTIYCWNRRYPSDKKLPAGFLDHYAMISEQDFFGSSHEKITERKYIKK